jgi:hypothetical protein
LSSNRKFDQKVKRSIPSVNKFFSLLCLSFSRVSSSLAIDIHDGADIEQSLCCFNCSASQSGTITGLKGRKGPYSPDALLLFCSSLIVLNWKRGTISISTYSAKYSSSFAEIFISSSTNLRKALFCVLIYPSLVLARNECSVRPLSESPCSA